MPNSPIVSRLNVQQNWLNDIPLKFIWTVDFSTRQGKDLTEIGSRIRNILRTYEARNTDSWPVFDNLPKLQSDSTGTHGYLLAQNIAFPTETFNIVTLPIEHSGGFINGYVGGDRNPYGSQNKLDITFLETNTDIIDYFIKPWIIASSYKGLIEDGITNEDLKCNITVVLYTRDKSTYSNSSTTTASNYKMTPRKKITFYNAVPYQVEADGVSYSDLSFNELAKTVAFAFSHYNTIIVR